MAVVLLVVSIVFGVYVGFRFSKGNVKIGLMLLALLATVPLLLWMLDGSAYAQLYPSLDDPWQGGCGRCLPESVIEQLTRLNYGAWHFVLIAPVVSVLSFIFLKKKRTHR